MPGVRGQDLGPGAGRGLGASDLSVLRAPPGLHRRRRGEQQEPAAVERGAAQEQIARVQARRARRLVGRVVLVDQRQRGRGRQRGEQGGAGPDHHAAAPARGREPGAAPLGLGHPAVEADRVEPARPARGGLAVGRDDERGAGLALEMLGEPGLPAMIRPELGLVRGARRRIGGGRDGLRRERARRGRQQGQERGAPRGEALARGPARQLERGVRQQRHRLDRPLERLQGGRVAFTEPDHHPHTAPAVEWRAHPLAPGHAEARRDRVGERVVDGDIEDDIRDQPSVRPPSFARASYSRRASFRSSQAMRLNSWPGLRSRNAGWKVGTSTAVRKA